jgi:hypothetical protein
VKNVSAKEIHTEDAFDWMTGGLSKFAQVLATHEAHPLERQPADGAPRGFVELDLGEPSRRVHDSGLARPAQINRDVEDALAATGVNKQETFLAGNGDRHDQRIAAFGHGEALKYRFGWNPSRRFSMNDERAEKYQRKGDGGPGISRH